MAAVDAAEPKLGYRGYIISAGADDVSADAGLPDLFRVDGGMTDELIPHPTLALPALSGVEADDTARWLLTTAEKEVPDDLLNFVKGEIGKPGLVVGKTKTKSALPKVDKKAETALSKAIAVAACVIQNTPYNPAFWNTPATQPHNNCYNYAMNYRSNTFAQPGRISGHPNTVMQCANVATAANFDGCTAACAGPNKTVALVIWPGSDYHWYRLHSNGFWGHKPGSTSARNTDNQGRVIGGALNPQNCDRGPYTIFCGYRFSPVGMRVS
jgi:hypothetical protein